MTHFIEINNCTAVQIKMGCTHPNMKNNSTESVGCNGDCYNCHYGTATMSILDIMALVKEANKRMSNVSTGRHIEIS